MKMKFVWAACLLAALPLAASAEDSPKVAAGTGGIELGELVTRFAARTGRKFVLDPRVRAQVPLAGIDPAEINYEQLLAIFYVHQFAAVDSGDVLAVVPDANARQFPAPVYLDTNFKALDHEIVNLLVTPKKVCANFLVPVLRPLMPQAAHLAAEIQTNTLIINDRAVNARRIAALVEQIDRRGTGARDCQPQPPAGAPASPAKPAG